MSWFHGLKLYVVVNDRGEFLALCLTPGDEDNRRQVPCLTRRPFAKLFGERGYISQALAEQLLTTQNVLLIATLRKRAIIGRVNDQLKNICQIEHTHHCSPYNFLAHLLAWLIAYCHQRKKPSLHLDRAPACSAAG